VCAQCESGLCGVAGVCCASDCSTSVSGSECLTGTCNGTAVCTVRAASSNCTYCVAADSFGAVYSTGFCDGVSAACAPLSVVGESCFVDEAGVAENVACVTGLCNATSSQCDGTGAHGDACVASDSAIAQAHCTDSGRCRPNGTTPADSGAPGVCDAQCLTETNGSFPLFECATALSCVCVV
jgi:hypothetical protein